MEDNIYGVPLYEGERIDEVNDRLRLIQKPEGLTFGTDALLLAAFVNEKSKKGLELGAGSGIISMLLLTRGKLSSAKCLEVQDEYASLTERNARLNSLSDKLTVECADIRYADLSDSYDAVYTNPPYMKTDSGKENAVTKKNVARHEVFGDIYDFCRSAKRGLKFGGNFYAVYRPDRLIDLISAMRSSAIEPKRIIPVIADMKKSPSVVLVEGKLGGKSGLFYTPPFVIYTDEKHEKYTPHMDYVMENGAFPKEFIAR